MLNSEFVRRLLHWHRQHRRIFPWRLSRDPYRVLIAELMLQRTQAQQVRPIYEKFVSKFPKPMPITEPTASAVLKPLGLAHRIPRIKTLMMELAELGYVPDNMEDLLELSGVGRYIASAVLCFGFGKDVPIVDVNVARVLGRVFGLKPKCRPHNDPNILKLAARLVPIGKGPEYNEALLDLAALVCKPKPLCDMCPLRKLCRYYVKVSKV